MAFLFAFFLTVMAFWPRPGWAGGKGVHSRPDTAGWSGQVRLRSVQILFFNLDMTIIFSGLWGVREKRCAIAVVACPEAITKNFLNEFIAGLVN